MFLLGHMGIGRVLARPFLSQEWLALPRTAGFLALGTLLPDLIDKPIYYGNLWFDWGLEWATCTRTLGHTGVLIVSLGVLSFLVRSRAGILITLGVATHLLLDAVGDRFLVPPGMESSASLALVFPLWSDHFGRMPFDSLGSHAASILHPYTFGGEVLGGLVLLRDRFRNRRREIR